MRIDIISDTICPWCFIGKRRLESALAETPDLAPEILWHPFQLNPDMPPDGMDRAHYLEAKFGGGTRAREIYRVVTRAAENAGLDLNIDAIRRTPNTLASHRLIHRAKAEGRQTAVVEALFKAYFLDGQDIGQVPVLAEIGAGAGLDRDTIATFLASDEDQDLIRAEDVRARKLGINGVPCFIIDGRYAISGAQEPEVFRQVFAVVAGGADETELAG
jgi:predicted DsbA family dithiol-disulfide isomerase